MLAGLVGISITIIIVVAVFQFAPTIGGKIEESQPALGASSDWNATHNTNLPNAASYWEDWAGLIALVVTVALIAMALAYLVFMGR